MKRKQALAILWIISLSIMLLFGCDRVDTPEVQSVRLTVLAAADLALAFEEVGDVFEEQTGVMPVFSFGSSGQITEQIRNGAKADVFASANITYVDELREQKLVDEGTQRTYALGMIAIASAKKGKAHPLTLEELKDPSIERIAIANPGHAPYGVAAKEALTNSGIWFEIADKIVMGENAQQTMQFTLTGNADAGIVPISLTVDSEAEWAAVPENLYTPLKQSIAVISASSNKGDAGKFIDLVMSREGQEILRKYGFGEPPK